VNACLLAQRGQATHLWIKHVAAIREEDALIEFVNLNPDDTDQIIGFITRYGLFSFGDVVGMAHGKKKRQPV